MAIDKIIQKITSSPLYGNAQKAVNSAASAIGTQFEKSPVKDIFSKYIEPVGANNKFMGLAGLMVFCVISPRVKTAIKRNPDNPEATKDEIKEILFRDVQSVLVVLFMLKTLNSLIAAAIKKQNGLLMTSKPYQKLFDESIQGLSAKAKDLVSHPIEKLKIMGKNVLDALHPTEGVRAKINNEYSSEYSRYTWEQLPKFFKRIEDEKGDKTKVFNTIVEGAIKKYENILNGNPKKGIPGLISKLKASVGREGTPVEELQKTTENIEATISELQKLRGKSPEVLSEVENPAVKNAITDFLADGNNALVQSGKGANGWLRLGALTMEASYLGFGIPALNQLRLEKKYLRDHKGEIPYSKDSADNGSALINKNIKAHEIKLYQNFIK